jgi:glycosyltransferase involved in cell wall biosynthesis
VSGFTVVTPNYNMGAYLEWTILSVLANLSPEDEYYVVDGGSTDDSVRILERYSTHLSGWISERDRSYADAVAKGFARGSGELLCWVNSGDLLLKNALHHAKRELADDGVDFIYGDDLYVDEKNRVLRRSRADVTELFSYMLYGGWTPLQDACFWKRVTYERAGGINPTLKYAGDYDLFLRMSRVARCRYVPKIFSAFRRHDTQKSISGRQQYAAERTQCRRDVSEEIHAKRMLGLWARRTYYGAAVRIRHHVRDRLRQPTRLAGVDALTIECGRYS